MLSFDLGQSIGKGIETFWIMYLTEVYTSQLSLKFFDAQFHIYAILLQSCFDAQFV